MLPTAARGPLADQLERARVLHGPISKTGGGRVQLLGALERKSPAWAAALGWQWVFPARRRYVDAAAGAPRRHHLHETVVQRAVQRAVQASGLRSMRVVIRFATRSRRTCWRTDTTLGRFRNCSATPM